MRHPIEQIPTKLCENEDWLVTKEIYADAVLTEDDYCATLRIPIIVSNMLAVRIRNDYDEQQRGKHNKQSKKIIENGDVKPCLQYLVLDKLDDPPVIKLSIDYSRQHKKNKKISVTFLQYPQLFPASAKTPWAEWISSRANDIFEETGQVSFSVCNFIEHEALSTYFELFDDSSMYGFSAIFFESHLFGYYDLKWEDQSDERSRIIHDIRRLKKREQNKNNDNNIPIIHRYARRAMKRNWKRFYEYICPICFCPEKCSDGVELLCGHFYCKECILTYMSTIIEDIKMHRVDPFICPITSCKANMNVLQQIPCDEKSPGTNTNIDINHDPSNYNVPCHRLLNKEQIQKIRLWKKDTYFPRSNLLTTCPRVSCKGKEVRRLNDDKKMTLVRCEDCKAIFCELCLKRIPGNKQHNCDETKVLILVRRYNNATSERQAKCDQKLHWIADYASVREVDSSALSWVEEFASLCPNCKNGIERIEGCFHMSCPNCSTHFCYECGEELFPPYYGTHHCWERQIEQVAQFI